MRLGHGWPMPLALARFSCDLRKGSRWFACRPRNCRHYRTNNQQQVFVSTIMTEEPESNAAALERKQKKEKKKQKKRDKAMHVNEENDKGLTDSSFNEERSKKQHKKDKKKKKKRKQKESSETSKAKKPKLEGLVDGVRPFVESSALEFTGIDERPPDQNTTLLLFYQYVEPDWTTEFYKIAKETVERIGNDCGVTGRMRVAREGLNCTLTGTSASIQAFCRALREWQPQVFNATEFKLTHDLPDKQRFPMLKLIPVTELVHYGLEGDKAPPIRNYHGTHLEPSEYHQKLAAEDTVVIDVRNHYEAAIGRFDPPSADGQKWLDPKMRKSTEFPVWLDHPETKEKLKGKQVLMYCTGGIRCERASALLKYRMETDPAVKELGIQGVYQLQGKPTIVAGLHRCTLLLNVIQVVSTSTSRSSRTAAIGKVCFLATA